MYPERLWRGKITLGQFRFQTKEKKGVLKTL